MNHQANFYHFLFIFVFKQDQTVWMILILRGGNNLKNYLPLQFLDSYIFL